MAAATGCNLTTHLIFRGTLPFIHSYRRTIAVASGGLPGKRRRSIAVPPHKGKFAPSPLIRSCPQISISYGGGIRGMPVLCYSTETEAQNSTAATTPTTVGEDDGAAIREAANTLDLRVGKILKAWRHEEADSLYVEEVDVGEPEPRTICSGLVKYTPLELLQDRSVVVFANLKPRNMRGVKSFGMLMAASDAAHENVELIVPPEGAVPGERVWFGSLDEKDKLPEVASPNQASFYDQ
ncbi:Nucleic acid-binding- OB-fold-like protein [Striga hermonthica]|uniref:Nucleic acid-binding- OB-fold-like protein n=1 Tax=Striga hermonthica TaxID=68872 RepID=A0A9N7RL31_STRHE|nr:Nucleic acid-binding- OB-fold-like protein [Striga hermonthica]